MMVNDIKGLILDIDRFSVHDGPGIRAAIFLKGCPLACKWCHSPESQKKATEIIFQSSRCSGCEKCACEKKTKPEGCDSCFACARACPTHALHVCGEWRSPEDVLETILPDKIFYENSDGGITVTGGEILMQAEFTKAFLSLCVDAGIQTAIETCGYGSQSALMDMPMLCDLIFYDIKLMDSSKHKQYTGVDNELIMANLAALCTLPGAADKIIIRVPCIPGINDSPEHIADIARFALSHGVKKVELLPYNASAGAKYEWLRRPFELDLIDEPRPQSYYDNLNEIVSSILEG